VTVPPSTEGFISSVNNQQQQQHQQQAVRTCGELDRVAHAVVDALLQATEVSDEDLLFLVVIILILN
jgi:deoxycytidylate deaminase